MLGVVVIASFFGFSVLGQVAGTFCLVKPEVIPNKITYTLYNHMNMNGVQLDDKNLNQVNPAIRTTFIIHGWLQDSMQEWIIQMKDQYLLVEDNNVIVVDWSDYSFCFNYFQSAKTVPDVGVVVADLIWKLASNGYVQFFSIQINGFCLGAHVAGAAGAKIQLQSGGVKIRRIIALDATSRNFEDAALDVRLDAGDAECVHAYHCSIFGTKAPYGTVDVYFNRKGSNCGRVQPGCPKKPGVPLPSNPLLSIMSCNHIRCVSYFTYSISQPSDMLLAVGCNCEDFGSRTCTGPWIVVGENLPCSVEPGRYYLNTRCEAPYGMSEAGVVGGNADYTCTV